MLNEMQSSLPDGIQKKLSSNIHNGAQTLVSRLEELLDLASYSRGTFKLHLQPADINQMIKDVTAEFQPGLCQKCQNLRVEYTENLPPVEADAERLRQVLLNLLSNASKFSPQNSTITLRVHLKDQSLFVEVIDKGLGISAEEQSRLFQPYHRVEQDRQKFPGIGLGLAVCKQIIEAHQGKIWVNSQLEKGSTFSFTIPLKQNQN
jgi:signal transduction histidine kinase